MISKGLAAVLRQIGERVGIGAEQLEVIDNEAKLSKPDPDAAPKPAAPKPAKSKSSTSSKPAAASK